MQTVKDNLVFPTHVAWRTTLDSAAAGIDIFGRQTRSRIRKALACIEDSPYRFVHESVDQSYLDAFVPLYMDRIGGMERGNVYDVQTTITDNMKQGREYKALSLYRGDELCGGAIYSLREKSFSVAYRIFPHTLDIDIPGNIGFVADSLVYERAIEAKKQFVLHGKDRNVFGPYSNIGLAMYKLQAGARPFVSKAEENAFHTELPDCDSDMLIFLGKEKGEDIKECLLVTDNADDEAIKKQYNRLFSYPDDLSVTIVKK